MSRRIIAGLAAAGVAILASCSQDRSPNVSLPTEASLARTPAAPTCSFSTASNDAKAYFTNTTGQTKDPVFALLDAMAAAPAGATRISAGFDVLRRLGDAANTTAVKGTSAQGSAFANDVLLCMSLSSVNLTSALGPDGLFAVRADTEAKPVVAYSGRYGAQPSTGKWPVVGEVVFYGVKVTPSANFDDTPVPSASVFDLKTIPGDLTFSPGILVGVCDLPDVPSSDKARILHLHGTDAVVLPQNAPTFCPETFTSLETPSSMFAFAAHRVASWFAPKPAFAASRAFMPITKKIGGGTVGGLSEIGPILPIDTLIISRVPKASVSDTALALDTLPHAVGDPVQLNTATSQFNPVVTVRALTKTGRNALAGVTVTLTVIGNKGSFASFCGATGSPEPGLAH